MSNRENRNEFRKHKPSGHPGYIFRKKGNCYEFIGITHDNKDGAKIPLSKNPEPGNTTQAFMKPRPELDRETKFKGILPGWKIGDDDKLKVEKVKKQPPIDDR